MKEDDEENTEEVFIKCLTEMGAYNPDMKFHAVHRVGRTREKTRGGSYRSKPDNPRRIIARFISRKDRYLVWSQRDEIKKQQNISVMLSSSLTQLKNMLRKALSLDRHFDVQGTCSS